MGRTASSVGIVGIVPADGSAAPHILFRERGTLLASARWSPDGTRIAVVRRNADGLLASIVVADVAGGTPRHFRAEPGRAYGALTWNGDGRTMIVTQKGAE